MKSSEVRQSFIDYFAQRGHEHRPSAGLVPHGDATLLFTNAGMVQFKDFFLGLEPPPFLRAVTSQKCMRVSGKHNDLENVGPSPRHHTFFEMLGNFSFGDYFKAEAIEFAWELVTGVWGLPPEHLFATVYEQDDDAEDLWRRISGLPSERVLRCGKKDNFWSMGDTGPCGPCSEIFVDLHPGESHGDWHEGSENGRYLEIWNLVFMQFDRATDGTLSELPNPSIDTGAGLERVAAVLQGVESNYDTDLFQPLLRSTAVLAGREYGAQADDDVSMRVIADHLRAVTFLLADGVIPSNEGRGYVLRRILRRAVRHGMNLGFEDPFLNRLVPVVGEVLGAHYPELAATGRSSVDTVAAEESKFLETVARASQQVQAAIDRARAAGESVLDGETVFRFYDTHGLPVELIREIAEEERFAIDEEGFTRELEGQRSRSRAASMGGKNRLEQASLEDTAPSRFIGYSTLEEPQAVVSGVSLELTEGEHSGEFVPLKASQSLVAGEAGVAAFEPTPFYAEAGGQVGDRGVLTWKGGGRAVVTDTQKSRLDTHLHFLTVEKGELRVGQTVRAEVDPAHRRPTQRNHTATHLLQAALRHVLGEGVRQAGSLVAPDRLRFDFTHGGPLTTTQLDEIEDIVNRWVLAAKDVEITDDRDLDEAVKAGAMALFGEKYDDRVRTVEVAGGVGSFELCGGCHVRNTGEIGSMQIVSERGVASGVRRIEALTGEGALAETRRRRALLARASEELDSSEERLVEEIRSLKAHSRELERELSRARIELVSSAGDDDEAVDVDGVAVWVREVAPAPPSELRTMADVLRGKLGSGVVVLGSRGDGKVSLVVAVTPDVTDRLQASDLVGELAPMVGGAGGGRLDFAQAGGRQPENLDATLAAAPEIVRRLLG
ncbi:MAG: alanine--tRNA ligase [Acidobacteria bacterium]|nr:alanine--tRNA ligase [Acidobacteriota bacterium]